MSDSGLLLFDTASVYFRAFFGVPTAVRAPDGRPVNAVRGLLDFLARFITDYSPTRLACCWDNSWRPLWRVVLIPSYKAHRVGDDGEDIPAELALQIPLITEVLTAVGVPIIGADGYEADDVIGTLANREPGPVGVVTGDRDLFQVVDDAAGIRVLYLGRGAGQHDRVDAAWLRQRYGVNPEQYVDFAILRGDPSDGLPGVPGIGEKTAARLLADFGDLAGIRTAAEAGLLTAKMTDSVMSAADYLTAATPVVAVERQVDLPEVDLRLPASVAHPDRFDELVTELGLGGSAERLRVALQTAAQARST
ncbi:MAG TPA: 5'-3' exonuclease H3TH domain-containing protein [Propionicimonas sp.]|nr:5'-3' exonuclease H3TH domain-containing protein [Propionicimonas sp.]